MKKILFLSVLLISSNLLFSQMTFIPDHNFEQVLIDLGYDSGEIDNYIVTDSIKGITRLDIKDKNISDLTGIEDFLALESIECSNNNLTALNLSQNVLLMSLSCANNQLTSLDISHNTSLTRLWLISNRLSSLDISQNKALSDVVCADNQLTTLDISQNTNLSYLGVDGNQLSSFDGGNNTSLNSLNCGNNRLTSLNIAQNTSLTSLYCSGNQLASIDLSHNTSLVTLYCQFNLLTSLDVSHNTSLKQLICNADGNQITSLDLSNNIALTDLDCTANPLKNLDVSHNTSLENLKCDKTELTTLDVSQNIALKSLFCSSNQIDSLDVTKNVNLTDLNCEGNGMTKLNLIEDKVLNYLYCANNRLTFESLETIAESAPIVDSTQSNLSTEIVNTKKASIQKQLQSISAFGNPLEMNDALYINYRNNIRNPNFKSSNTGSEMFHYAPQDTLGKSQIITMKAGDNFNYNIHVGGKYSMYQWYKNGVLVPNHTSDSLNLTNISKTDVGKYTLRVTNTKLPELTLYFRPITLKVNLNTGNNVLTENPITFYPNPSKGILKIEGLPINQETRISVYNLDGKLIKTKTINALSGEIDIRDQISGYYLLKVNNHPFKIVKE